MRELCLRIELAVMAAFFAIAAFAQEDEAEIFDGSKKRGVEDELEEIVDYQPFHLKMDDVLVVILILVACYVFGKIWKGCSYMILVLAALFYYMMH